jgi:hypothetical protein
VSQVDGIVRVRARTAAVGFATAVNATDPRANTPLAAATDDVVRSFADVRRAGLEVVTKTGLQTVFSTDSGNPPRYHGRR